MARKKRLISKTYISSLSLGLVITAAFVFIAISYYSTHETEKDTLFYRGLDRLHTGSLDLKMQVRGMKYVKDSPLAIIAIDNRSIDQIGRWPWPRQKVAKMIQHLFDLGVKNVGLDILYSEPSNQEILGLISEVSQKEGMKKFSQEKRATYDVDKQMAELFKKYPERLIAAAIYDLPRGLHRPYQRICLNQAYEQNTHFEFWEEQGYDFIRINSENSFPEIPELISSRLSTQLQSIRETAVESFCKNKKVKNCPESLNSSQKKIIANDSYELQMKYCEKWLLSSKDANFQKTKKAWQNTFPEKSFESFLINLRKSSFYRALTPIQKWTLNIPSIHYNARFAGFLNVHPDIDGTIRKLPMLVGSGEHIIPSLSMRMAMALLGADGGQISSTRHRHSPKHLTVSDLDLTREADPIHSVPIDQQGNARLNYNGPKYTFPHISARELLDAEQPNISLTHLYYDGTSKEKTKLHRNKLVSKSFLKGKSVIIGATATGIYDLRVTPFDENYPGVEGHITAAHNILNEDLLFSNNSEPEYMFLLIVALGVTLTLLLTFFGSAFGFVFSFICTVSLILIDYNYYFKNNQAVAIIFPLFLTLALYVFITILKYFTEERKKKVLRGTFEKYVSPSIVNEVMNHPDNLKLGGRKEHMTVFFSDVRGFTTISEALEPEELSHLLNLYLTPMTQIVFANNGTLDKYMGDAVMAFFGAPVTSQTHPEDACRCALQSLEHLEKLNAELVEKKLPTIDIGIGVNTGDMSVGNMGSQTVRNYTVMGDSVNLGARIEGINKQYGTQTIISEFTEKELSEQFIRREIDWVKVKGKDKPVRIFELIAEGDIPRNQKESLKHFRRGYHFYHQMKWQEGIDEFKRAQELMNGKDSVSKLYIQRCHEFLSHPPEGEWDGVFVMKTK